MSEWTKIVVALVVGLGLVSGVQAGLYSEDFDGGGTDGFTWGANAGAEDSPNWNKLGGSTTVSPLYGINGSMAPRITTLGAGDDFGVNALFRSTGLTENTLIYRALVNVSSPSGADIVQLNMFSSDSLPGSNDRLELGISPTGFNFYAGTPEQSFPTDLNVGWFEVETVYTKGTPGSAVVSWRDVNDTTGAASGGFSVVGSFNTGGKSGQMDWDMAAHGYSFRNKGRGDSSEFGPRVDNLSLDIPEPAVLALFAAAAPLLLGRRRRTR
jgi:hypothetical protein